MLSRRCLPRAGVGLTLRLRHRYLKAVFGLMPVVTDIPVAVYESLIGAFKDNLPTWHKYWDVRRRALGLDEHHPYDIWAPLLPDPPQISYEDAFEMIAEGLAPLGDEYVSVMRQGVLQDRWIDAMPNAGKRQGGVLLWRTGYASLHHDDATTTRSRG